MCFAPRVTSSRALPQGYGASMDANPGAQREICEPLVVRKREADSIGRLIEQEKETIGAIDFATTMLGEKLARTPVV